VNAEALDIFLRGRYVRQQRKFGDLRAGMDFFERAIRLDPDFAEAHAALASAYTSIAFHDQASADNASRHARVSADRALALNENLPGAHLVRAQLAYFRDWDWGTSDREFRRALELNPSYAMARQGFALSLLARGRFREAIAESHKALELDPLSYTVSNDLGAILWAAGRHEEAIRRSREILTLASDLQPPHLLLGALYASRGQYKEAIAEYEPQRRSGVFGSELLGRLGYAYAAAGRRADALAVMAELEQLPEGARVYAHLATLYVGLGDKQRALECLEKSAQRRETEAVFAAVEPHYNPLHNEPRFQAIRKRIGI
jgi:tetratricopeptide (TPR) repeat protein